MAAETRDQVQCGACRQWVDLVEGAPMMVSHLLPGEPPQRCWSGGTTNWEWPIRRAPTTAEPGYTPPATTPEETR